MRGSYGSRAEKEFAIWWGNNFRVWSLIRLVSNQNGNEDKEHIIH